MKIVAPTNCPSCGSDLVWVKDQLFCRNKSCPAQSTKKLQHFCKVLKIKGFGEKTLEKLELSHINDLLDYTTEYGVSVGLGEKTATNLYNEVQKRLDLGINVSDFIAGQSIPLVGATISNKLTGDISDITFEVLKELGVGDKAATNLISWVDNEWPSLSNRWNQYLKISKPITTAANNIKGDVCITGKLDNFKNRTDAALHLQSLGWNVKKSVTKTVKYLICEDGNTSSSSYKKAIENDIKVLTIEQLEDM